MDCLLWLRPVTPPPPKPSTDYNVSIVPVDSNYTTDVGEYYQQPIALLGDKTHDTTQKGYDILLVKGIIYNNIIT